MEVQSVCCRVRPLSSVLCRLSFLRPLSAVRCRLPFSRLLSVLALACVVCTAFSAEAAGAREEARPKGLFADGAFRVGCNYWASHAGMMMWRNWDAAQVERVLCSDANPVTLRDGQLTIGLNAPFQAVAVYLTGGQN